MMDLDRQDWADWDAHRRSSAPITGPRGSCIVRQGSRGAFTGWVVSQLSGPTPNDPVLPSRSLAEAVARQLVGSATPDDEAALHAFWGD